MRVLSTATFRTLVTLRLCERIERTEAELEEGRLAAKTRTAASPLGNEQLDAERRRYGSAGPRPEAMALACADRGAKVTGSLGVPTAQCWAQAKGTAGAQQPPGHRGAPPGGAARRRAPRRERRRR